MTPGALAITGALVPALYFGAQALGAPLYPDFSLLRTTASDLGSPASAAPWVVNAGALLGGMAGLAAAFVWARLLPRLGVGRLVTVLLVLALALLGLSSAWAGLYPLPDARHAANPGTPGLLALPILLPLALWRVSGRGLRVYLTLNLLAFAVLCGVFSGALPVQRDGLEGLWQRLLALTVYLPVGVAGVAMGRAPAPSPAAPAQSR